jgi:tetratricopeptide (TPR) repeat protein
MAADSPCAAKKPWRRRLKRCCVAAGVLAVALLAVGFAASLAINYVCEAHPPKVDPLPAIVQSHVEVTGEVRRLGACSLARKDGILRMTLAGDPFELGYANAALCQPFLEEQEHSFIDMIHGFVPSKAALWLITKLVVLRNRSLPSYVMADHQMEIYGLACAYKDPMPEIGPLYHRLLNYHAAHDISHAIMDNPLVGCTGFAAWDKATRNGHLLLARNFDFNAGRCFDTNKIVYRVKPDRGLGYISVAWPGMIGVVSGMNDAKIAVTVNACYTKLPWGTGTPVALMLRQVLQYASSLDEAADLIAKTHVCVSDAYLIADGKTGRAIIVEKSPGHTAVRRPGEGEDTIVCSNHFLADEMFDLPGNREYMRDGTTVPRFDRMRGLVEQRHGALTPESCATILRDRQVPGDVPAGWGNAASINCLIATHAVIMDVTEGVVWVSASPHQLGAFIPFGLDDFENPKGVSAIAPDPMLGDGSYERYSASQECLAEAKTLAKQHKTRDAMDRLAKASELNPDSYTPCYLLGKMAFGEGAAAEARAWLERAAARYPAYESERREIEDLLRRINAKQGNARP